LIKPNIDELLKKADDRYTLVVISAKRARQLCDGEIPLTSFKSDKAVILAIHEINEGKITYVRTKSSIK
jgi:DNA-directed RNA polymerase subunit omega